MPEQAMVSYDVANRRSESIPAKIAIRGLEFKPSSQRIENCSERRALKMVGHPRPRVSELSKFKILIGLALTRLMSYLSGVTS